MCIFLPNLYKGVLGSAIIECSKNRAYNGFRQGKKPCSSEWGIWSLKLHEGTLKTEYSRNSITFATLNNTNCEMQNNL